MRLPIVEMEDVLAFWHLREDPFADKLQDSTYFYQSIQHKDAINRVVSGIKDLKVELAQIAGEVGTGKTFTCQIIGGYLSSKYGFTTLHVTESYKKYEQLLCTIATSVAGRPVSDPIEANHLLDSFLNEIYRRQGQFLLTLDEAQRYDMETLDWIRQLVNKNIKYSYRVLALLLVGQPELVANVKALPQLESRIRIKQYFNNLSQEEVPKYILFRLWTASKDPELRGKASMLAEAPAREELRQSPFVKCANEIYRATLGSPRSINFLCSEILAAAAQRGEKVIKLETARAVIREREQNGY